MTSFKLWVAIASGLFALGLLLGFTVRGSATDFIAQNIASLQELAAELGPFKFSTAAIIFLKNASALLISFGLSPVLWLMPIVTLTINGWVLAYVAVIVARQTSIGLVLGAILPHGVFEIPAIIIGEAAALGFGWAVMGAVVSSKQREQLLPRVRQSLRYLVMSMVMLVPAALIETFVTPAIAGR